MALIIIGIIGLLLLAIIALELWEVLNWFAQIYWETVPPEERTFHDSCFPPTSPNTLHRHRL